MKLDDSVWEKLYLDIPDGDKILARCSFPLDSDKVFCAIDSEKRRHLLIHLPPSEKDYKDTHSRGLIATTRELIINNGEMIRYIDIECLDRFGYPILDIMAAEIAEGLINGSIQSATVVNNVLAKWRRFWGNIPNNMLSKEEQIGLFAELWFLLFWLFPHLGARAALTWRGPWGGNHDFEWQGSSVEVKGTCNSRGRIFEINSINQLENSINTPLNFFGVVLREEVQSDFSLPFLVCKLQQNFEDLPDSLDMLEKGLIKIGYSPVHNEGYEKLRLRVVEQILFDVNDKFPKITKISLADGFMGGIEKVKYDINLNTFNDLIISSSPNEFRLSKEKSI